MGHVVKIKRKKEEEPLTAFVIEDDRPSKRATLIESLSSKLTLSDTTPVAKPENEKEQKLKERKLFRLAYTITDKNKIKEFAKSSHKIESQKKRDNLVKGHRSDVISNKVNTTTSSTSSLKNKTAEEDYVIDVYYFNEKDQKLEEDKLDEYDIVKLESFREDLLFEDELINGEEYDSEDSNAEEQPWNDYPEEESDFDEEECSDDNSEEHTSYRHYNSRLYYNDDLEEEDEDDFNFERDDNTHHRSMYNEEIIEEYDDDYNPLD